MLKSCKNKNLTRHKKIAPAKNNAEVIFNEQKKKQKPKQKRRQGNY